MTPNSGLDVLQQNQITQPQQQQGDEHNPSSPMQGTAQEPQNSGNISKEDQDRLIALVRKYKEQWSQDRLILSNRVTANIELFKGNPNFFYGGGENGFGIGGGGYGGGTSSAHAQDADDDTLFEGSSNFYQLLALGWMSALVPQLPKSKFRPEDADDLADVATTKAAQLVIDKVERDNKENSLYRQQLFTMYNCGTAFRYTRYVVDKNRATKKQPIFDTTDTEILPDRYHCFNCGTDNPEPGTCQNCNSAMGGDSFYPAVVGPVTKQIGTEEVAVGMTAQNIYSPLEVDMDPDAEKVIDSPIMNLEYEVHISALRGAYPDMYDKIQSSATSELSVNGSQDRINRRLIDSQTYGQSSILSDQRPTLSKSWIQAWAFDLEDDREFGKRMREAFPTGCLLINCGPTFLNAKEDDPNKRWTMTRCHEGMGAYCPCPGDIVRPFQITYNDVSAMLKDAIERMALGITLVNNDLIDSRSLEGKRPVAGSLTPVKLKRTGAPGSASLKDALFQFEYALKLAELLEYLKYLMFSAQTFAGIQPQTYGGPGDPNVQTAKGQAQQLDTAVGVIGVYWQNLKEEHAEADGLAVECTAANLTEDLQYAIEEKGEEFRNQKVSLDDLQGSIKAYSDIDQGLPVTAAELRERLMSLYEMAPKNPLVLALFNEPENQEMAVSSTGIPGLVVPGGAMRIKTLLIIEKLLKSPPVPSTDPQTGQQTMQPTIMPSPEFDDFTVLKEVVRQYAQQNADLPDENPGGWQNLLAYYTAAVAAETAQYAQNEVSKGKAALAGHMASLPPPPPKPQLSPADQSMLNMVRSDGAAAMRNLLDIGGQAALPKGSSLQAQVAANNDLLQLAAKVEQIAADKTAPPGQ